MFVLDVTGSMRQELEGVKRGIQSFANEISSRRLDGQVGLIAFGDRFIGEEPRILSFAGKPFTADIAGFSNEVSSVRMVDGGDPPESSLDALVLSASQPFRPGSIRAIVLITDAPPHVPDKETRTIDEVEDAFAKSHIEQLHLVINETDRAIYQPFQQRAPGEVFPLGETAAGRQGFERILPVVGRQIAEMTSKGLVTRKEFAAESRGRLTVLISLWTAVLASGVALALIVGQNHYQRRRWLGLKEAFKGGGGGFAAGLLAGVAGQLVFLPLANTPAVAWIGRVAGWGLLGALLGAGMSFFVPNLRLLRGALGGLMGGLLGSFGFLLTATLFGESAGRVTGAAVLGGCVGLMLALIEQLSREAAVVVYWHPKESTIISLGPSPVVLGSSAEAHVYLPKQQGFPSVAALLTFTDGKVEFDNKLTNSKHTLVNGNKLQIGSLTLEIRTAR
jgi:Ca-activated chloride channel family protein